MRAARLAVVFLASVWIVLLLAAPVAGLGVLASALTYAFGSLICHQRPERSFYVDAAQIPVCARCFGLYAGAAIGLIAGLKPCATQPVGSRQSWPVGSRQTWPVGSRQTWWRSPSGLRKALIVAALPTALTWSAEMLGLSAPSNLTRFIAALPLGAAVAVTINYVECARRQRTRPRSPRIHI